MLTAVEDLGNPAVMCDPLGRRLLLGPFMSGVYVKCILWWDGLKAIGEMEVRWSGLKWKQRERERERKREKRKKKEEGVGLRDALCAYTCLRVLARQW